MTLLSLANSFATLEGFEPFAELITSTNDTEQTFITLAQQAGDDLALRGDWPQQVEEITVAASATSTALPDDFLRVIEGGAVMMGDTGAVSEVYAKRATGIDAWRRLRKGLVTTPHYFIDGTNIEYAPAIPSNGAYVSYVSSRWIKNIGGVRQAVWGSDDDSAVFPERLMLKSVLWRWRSAFGFSYQRWLDEFEASLEIELAAAKGVMS